MRGGNKEGPRRCAFGPAGSFSRLGLAIPCWVAPQQSPTPFRQARETYIEDPTNGPGYQPQAPTGKCRDRRPQIPAKSAHRLRQRSARQNPQNQSLQSHGTEGITVRNHFIHWLVLSAHRWLVSKRPVTQWIKMLDKLSCTCQALQPPRINVAPIRDLLLRQPIRRGPAEIETGAKHGTRSRKARELMLAAFVLYDQ